MMMLSLIESETSPYELKSSAIIWCYHQFNC